MNLFSILFVSATLLYSQDYYKGDDMIKEGVHAFYNYEFREADSILSHAKELYPNHPGIHLIWVSSRWVHSQANDPISKTHKVLEEGLNQIKPIYNTLVDENPNDANYRLYQGSAIGLSARVTLGRKEWLKTLYRAYTGFSIIDDVAKEYPENMDAKLPIGIVEYYAGISNSFLKFAVNLYGLNPSVDSGLNQISLAADSSQWAWIEAKGILSFLYLWVEDNPIMALKYSQDLVKHFPNNFYFNILYLESLIRTNQNRRSYAIIKDMEFSKRNLTSRQKDWYSPYLDYERGLLAFHESKLDTAAFHLDNAINNYKAELDIILGNAYLLKGMIHDVMGERDLAKSTYYECIELDNFSSAMRLADQYLKMPYTQQP